MKKLHVVSLFGLMFMSILTAQEGTKGVVRVYALTEAGALIDAVRVRIESGMLSRTFEVKGSTPIELPYGVYTIACIHTTLATQFKIVRVEKPDPIDVIFGLPLANPGQVTGEGEFTPFEVSGRVTPAPKGIFSRVKAVGVLIEDTADSKIDDHGRFRLLLRNEGIYRLFVLYGKDIVSEKKLDLRFGMPRAVSLELRIEWKGRGLR